MPPDADIASWTAQVKVLRAFYANWLWKFYGNVPYYEREPHHALHRRTD